MVETFAAWILRYRSLVIAATLVFVALAASGGRFLQFTTDYRVFFSEENPQLQAFEKLQNTYTKNDNVLFVLAPKDGNVFSRETLETVARLTEAAWQIPYSIRVDSITNFQHTRAEEDDLVVEDLVVDPLALSDADLERIEGIALKEPLLVNRLISPKAHVTGVNVTIQLKGEQPEREVPETVVYARKLADEVRAAHPELDVHLTGIVMMNHMFSEASVKDMRTLVPLMFGVVILTLALLLRSPTATLGTVLVVVLSILAAMGLTGLLGIRLTPPSATAPTIILTLAVADSVHVLLTYLQGLRQGSARKAAMAESLRINFQPVFLTSLTTAIGFLSMNFSDAPPFRDLGNIVAMGVGIAFVLSVTFLPALATLLPMRVRARAVRRVHPMERFAEFVVHRRQPLLWGMSILVVFLILMIPRNELNDEFVKYFDERIAFRRDTDFTTANLTGIYTIDYSLESGESGGISNPDFQTHVEAFADWYREQPEVIHVNSFTDVMKRLNKNMHGDAPAWYRTPDARDLAAQYLLLYEMSLPFGLDLNNQINVAKSATRMSAALQSLSSNQLLNLEKRAGAWLQENAPASMQVEGSSPSVMFSHIGKRNIRSMLSGTTLALILISLILIVALRSAKIGLTSMIPNLVPAGAAFGLWALTVGQIGLSLSVVASMSLGIVVDDTVHFLSKYLRARREKGLGPQDAVRYAFSTVGTALWVTSLVLMAGFLILSLSAFEINAGMGLLTAVTIGIALAVDFLFLPPLLMKIEEKQHAKDAVADMVHSAAP
jgi:predicted RND superfamily exporter protein